jgi:hypothetical protein
MSFMDSVYASKTWRSCAKCGHRFQGDGAFFTGRSERFCSASCRDAYGAQLNAGNAANNAANNAASAAANAAAVAAAAAEKVAAKQREDLEKDHFRPSIEARVGRPLRLDDIVLNPRTGEFVAKTELEAEQQDARECLIRAWGVPASVVKECKDWDKEEKHWMFYTSITDKNTVSFPIASPFAIARYLNKPIQELNKEEYKRFSRVDVGKYIDMNIAKNAFVKFVGKVVRDPDSIKCDACGLKGIIYTNDNSNNNSEYVLSIAKQDPTDLCFYYYEDVSFEELQNRGLMSPKHFIKFVPSKIPPYIWRQPGELEQNAAAYDAIAAAIAAEVGKISPAPPPPLPKAAPAQPKIAFCPNCGTKTTAGVQFCGNCGTKVG